MLRMGEVCRCVGAERKTGTRDDLLDDHVGAIRAAGTGGDQLRHSASHASAITGCATTGAHKVADASTGA
jgi:hypothetical protein